MEQSQLDELYERASEHYLNGRFAEALQSWQQLLSLNPGDERAREGIRLAEIMADNEAAPEAAGPEPTGPVHAAPPAAPRAIDPAVAPDAVDKTPGQMIEIEEDLLVTPAQPAEESAGEVRSDELDDSLSVFDSLSVPEPISSPTVRDEAPSPAPKKTPAPKAETGQPSPAPESIDFGDLSAVASIPSAPAPQTDDESAGLTDDAASFAQPSTQPTPSDSDAVATELQKRIDDLLAEARAAAGDERDEDALGILSRIAILDEENLEARALEEQLRQRTQDMTTEIETWMTEGVQWLELGQTEEARERFRKVLEVAPEHLEAQDYLARADARLSGEEPSPPVDAASDSGIASAFAPASLNNQEQLNHQPLEAEPGTDAVPLAVTEGTEATPDVMPDLPAPRPGAAPEARSSRRVSPVVLVVLVVVVAAVGAGAWYAPMLMDKFLGGAAEEGTSALERAAAALPQPGSEVAADPAAQPVAPEPGTAVDLSPAERAERIAASMARGRDALEAADYSAAIVAFNEVLAIDPVNGDARQGIEEAGEGYRALKEADEQLIRGRNALEDGDYVSALRILYRLPDTVDQMQAAEYKVVGWYNLGLIELKAADCKGAVEHFDEALAIAPNDAHLRKVRSLAGSYIERAKDSKFYREVEVLDFLTPSR